MKKRIFALLMAFVMLLGVLPVGAFATEAEEPEVILCQTEGCEYAAGHEGNCSNYVEPTEACATEGCTYGANHEGNCSNYVEPSADELAAQQVVALIDAIGEVTLESEAAIAAADTAYNALTDAQKALVTNLAVLEAAKTAFMALSIPAPVNDSNDLKANVTITINNQGTLDVIKKSVAVVDQDNDGMLTYHDALVLLHNTHGKAYVAEESSYGLFVTTMWDVVTGGNCYFYLNDAPILYSVGTDTVKNGDYLYATNLADVYSWSDTYSYFDVSNKTVKAGEAFKLTLYGSIKDPYTWEITPVPLGGVAVGTYSGYSGGSFTALGQATDTNGQVTLTFETPGTYIVSASGYYMDEYGAEAPLMPPVCVVTVEAAAIVETVTLDKTELPMVVGDEQTLTATVTPAGTEVAWSSQDATVAEVDGGKITALKAGSTTITVTTAGGETASCLVTVSEPVVTYLSALKFRKSTSATSAEYELQPAFDPSIKEYTLIVPDTNTAVSVWATLDESQTGAIKAVYQNTSNKATTKTISSGVSTGVSLSSVLKSSLDGNTVTITVGGEEACKITIVRRATLKGLTLSYGEDKTAALDPAFNADKLEYTARVPQDAAVTVTPSKKISAAAVTINGAAETSVTPVWTGLTSEIEIVVSGGTAKPEVIPTTYKVSLLQCAVSLEILTPPTKTDYVAGDKFDPAGMTLKATYSDGSTETIGVDRFTYPEDALKPNTTEIEVGFDDLIVKQPITMPVVFEGSGTQAEPYLIKTTEDLVRLSEMVAGGLSFAGEYIKMVNDITLPTDWVPLGTGKTKPFSGNFDGGGNLLTVPEGGLPLIGFPIGASLCDLDIYGSRIEGFGVVNNYATGATITIDSVTLKSGTKTLKSGFVGGYASGQDALVIRNSTVEKGVIIGYSKDQQWIGSFGGEYNGTITNCVSYADVYGTEFVGGIVADKGQTMGDFIVTNCQFYGTVTGEKYVGGIVGHGYAGTQWGLDSAPCAPMVTIQNCTCSGTVTGSSYVGGILGAERAPAQVWENGIGYIQNNSFTGKVSGSSYVGGIIGYIRSLNKYTVITNNYYAMNCGAGEGIGGVEYVDTNCAAHETASGVTYLNTEISTAECPTIASCAWRKAHNRTDDPLGADKTKLCHTDTDLDPIATELKVSGAYKTEYTEGEDLDLSGIVLTVHYNWGNPKTLELKDVTVSGYDKTKTGNQTVTLAYGGLTADISVTVKSAKKEITVKVSVLGDSVHNSDSDGKVHTLAGGNLTAWISRMSVTLDSGATVFDAVKAALDEQSISFTYSYNAMYGSHYIESVNGLAEFTNGQRSGWMVTVNGVHISVGVSAYTLKDGDTVVLHYTDDYAKESGGMGDSDAAAVEKVEKLIEAIGTVTLDKADEITAARKAYDNLTYAQKQKVSNYAKLTDAEAKLAQLQKEEDKKAAKQVEDLIAKLDGNAATFEQDVEAAKKAYDALTPEQKKLVTNYKKLTDALKSLAEEKDVKAAEEVEKLIAAIGTVKLNSEEKIKTAREAYDKLTDKQKALVENITVLEAAEERLAELRQQNAAEDIYKTTGDYLEALSTPSPGSVGGEWMVIGLLRSDRKVKDMDAYYDAAVKYVQENIDENGRLHNAKSTENSRLILALTAMGEDVTDVGGYDLLAGLNSMDYVRKQGINGPIWALMALDSGNYPAPAGDVSREALLQVILEAQLADGGWALSGSTSDPDMTGMALQALATYYNTNAEVKKAVDAALTALSNMQNEDGTFASIDGKNSESIAQVITALSALGIDADTDPRFVKNGVSALDALCAFFVEGGGFKHIPSGELDGMATEQSYYALAAYFRMLEGKTALFNMTDVVDMGGDPTEEAPVETQPAEPETQAATEPAEVPGQDGRSFPWWLMGVIVVLLGAIGVLVTVYMYKKRED